MSDSILSRSADLPRRTFLRVAGASAVSASLLLAGCGKDDPPTPTGNPNLLPLPEGASGVLNYLFLLKQLKAAFYQKVVDAAPSDLVAGDKAFFDDLRDHELVHRETLRSVLGPGAYDANFVTPLAFDFSSFVLTTRAGVLAAAQQLEDLSVAAYAGALPLIKASGTVVLLAKIASAQARHAAFVRDLRAPGTFAGDDVVVSSGGLQSVSVAKNPTQVVADTKAFFLPVVVSVDRFFTA